MEHWRLRKTVTALPYQPFANSLSNVERHRAPLLSSDGRIIGADKKRRSWGQTICPKCRSPSGGHLTPCGRPEPGKRSVTFPSWQCKESCHVSLWLRDRVRPARPLKVIYGPLASCVTSGPRGSTEIKCKVVGMPLLRSPLIDKGKGQKRTPTEVGTRPRVKRLRPTRRRFLCCYLFFQGYGPRKLEEWARTK